MTTRSCVGILLFLTACSPVRVYAPELQAGVEQAVDSGLPVKLTDDPDAVVRVRVRPGLDGMAGHAADVNGCIRTAYVRPGVPANITAHELGHVLGLRHTDEAQNLMQPRIGSKDVVLTSKQRKRARAFAKVIKACEAIQ